MVAKNARDVLQKENELLDELSQKGIGDSPRTRGVEADIAMPGRSYFTPVARYQ